MKYEFYCRMNEDVNVINFLKDKNIKYETGPLAKRIYFTVYSDTENCDEFLKYIQKLMDDGNKKVEFGKESESRSVQFDIKFVQEQIFEIYKGLMESE